LKRAILKNRDKELYAIQFYNLAGRAFRELPGEQDGVAQKAKFKEYGRLFARLLAKKELEVPLPKRKVRFRGAKRPRDYPMLPFDE
jgi:hypothetical protein